MSHLGFLKIAIDPIAVGIDHRDIGGAYPSIVTHAHQKISDIAVHGTAHLGPLEVDVGLGDLLLGSVESGLRLGSVAGKYLLLFRCSGRDSKGACGARPGSA